MSNNGVRVRRRPPLFLLGGGLALGMLAGPSAGGGEVWPQFRGPGGLGVAVGATPPVIFGTATNLAWELALPSGNSSPCVWNDRVFLTSANPPELETYCVDATRGKLAWRRSVSVPKFESVHRQLGHPASATPVTDGEHVYVYFGSFGLIAYDLAGQELWTKPLPTPVTDYGASASPVLAGELLVQNCDQDLGSYLLAVDRRSGQTRWRTERPEALRGFGTPLIWQNGGVSEIVAPGTVWLKAYDPRDGRERWAVRGQARVVCTSPVIGAGLLLAASWSPGGDAGSRISMPAWEDFLRLHDGNHDGQLTRNEFPPGPLLERYAQIDANKDQVVTRAEWDGMREVFARAENSVLAVRPGGRGDITQTHVAWKQTRGLPYVPSPLCYEGRLYLVKNGGLVSCFDAATGQPHYTEERLGAVGDYYASPVAAAGRIYAASEPGTVVVFKAGDTLEVLARNELREHLMATPAIVGDTLFVRTASRLYAFRGPAAP